MGKLRNAISLVVLLSLVISLAACGSDQGASKDNTVTLYITRHGKTMLNTSDRVQGWADSPLTEAGVTVARQLGRGLKGIPFAAAYSSDSGRAIETANLVLEESGQADVKLTTDKNLREWNFGKYEGDLNANMWNVILQGLGITDMKQLDMKSNMGKVADTIAASDETGQAEDWEAISTRLRTALDEISEKTAENGGSNVLVVSHGLSISALLQTMDPSQVPPAGLENASVTKIIYKDGTYKIESVGDMSYAEKGEKENTK
ncbi:histidine phosphatase family protein [Paenibacillus lactis]|uniref:histidine phosphatase family protein n=1 Tax=Paenibacillus lactis TaxID=228574 RepID=UPI001B0B570B|nr:histidine phosphatase family protein [Paenibacillus lactis]GIO91459.1 phosphoglycerate mutase [Paenibacillus lactis]